MMKSFFCFLCVTICAAMAGFTQISTDSIYTRCDVMPSFPGGDSAYKAYVKRSIAMPKEALDSNIEGTAYVQFVVGSSGILTQIQLKKGILESLDKEILRVIYDMPAWTPAIVSDTAVKFRYVIPVVIRQLDYLKFDTLTEYLDGNDSLVNQDVSTYYRLVKKGKKSFLISKYLKDGTLIEEQECSKMKPETLHGRYVEYYENKNVKYEGRYVNNKKEGVFTYYNNDGRKLVVEKFKEDQLDGVSTYYAVDTDSDYVERVYDDGHLIDSQETHTSQNSQKSVFAAVDVIPCFPGGREAEIDFILKNLRYPIDAIHDRIRQGEVWIKFVVEKDGSITNISIYKDARGGFGDEAMNLVKWMPKWIPGTKRGKPVSMKVIMPFRFGLNNDR